MAKQSGLLMIGAIALSIVTGCDSDAQTVGPRGGILLSEDGQFSLEIPAGALETDVDLEVTEVECTLGDALGACYSVSPAGTTFLLPVEVAYELGDLEPELAQDVGVVAVTESGWRVLADRDVDLEDEVVYASSTYLSQYGLARVQ